MVDEHPGKNVPVLRNLTDLEVLYSCLNKTALSRLLRMCPNVERLTYVAGDEELVAEERLRFCVQFRPVDAQEVVNGFAKKLKRFRLDLTDDFLKSYTQQDMDRARLDLQRRGVVCEWMLEDGGVEGDNGFFNEDG